MKKYLALACAFSCAAALTACHDDDDDSEGFTASFASPYIQYSAINGLSAKLGVNSYVLSDDEHKIDLYHFNLDDLSQYLDTTGETRIASQYLETMGDNFYGGFCPTWYEADDDESYFVPINGSYHSGSQALLCNPGVACRALITKHYPMEFSLTNVVAAATAALTLGDASELYVCPTDCYTALTDSSYADDLEVNALPANHEIQFVVYGYVEHFSFSNFSSLISSVVSAGKSVGDGGELCEDVITLASSDANGNVTVNKEWQKMDLSSIGHDYILEAYIRVIDTTTGTTSKTYSIDSDTNSYLGYILIDDLSYNDKGGLASLL